MSGRVAVIESVASQPNVIYVGAATGGVWKSTNGGVSWEPVFDEQDTASIGAIAVCPSEPSIVWAGTGEGNPRNSAGVGRGVYKSLDGGKTWRKVGLEKTEHIVRIVLHPRDPDIAYVAAQGATWGESNERGVYRTTDGGRTWSRVLYVDARTGAADLAMAPDNPHRLLAAMWEHRRWPWFFRSGGPGSGLYTSSDGGDTWKKLTPKEGLPEGELGRCGVAFAPSRPNMAYALVEAKRSVLLRSDDGGATWKTVNSQANVSGRPFYYADLRINPRNENIVYSLQTWLRVSEDGGRTFRSLARWGQSHSDYHAMWIDPDGERLLVGNDGGLVISHDRGRTWRFVPNLPLAQYYHIAVDDEVPYNVYGGFQDNGSWVGPAAVLTDRAIYNHHWVSVGGGDGFGTEPDPEDSLSGYAMSQTGYLERFDRRTGLRRSIRPAETDVRHRYNWNAGLAIDPFDPKTLYYGSQFVHRSRDKGRTWEVISPDLTSNDPARQKQGESGGLTRDVSGAENYTTILAIAPSPVKPGVIWVGTDDGYVQLTRDGGQSWQRVGAGLTGSGRSRVPAGASVPHVEASAHDAAAAYVVFENHQQSDWTPYVFATRDYGRTWRSLATPDIDGYAWVIKEDPVQRDLLFLGTEFHLYVSFDGGRKWMTWTQGLPTVAVRALAIQRRENDLVIGTHGRSAYVIDDISPLRQVSDAVLRKPLHVFQAADAIQYRRGSLQVYYSPGDTQFKGANRAYGALITYVLNPAPAKKEVAGDATQKEAAGKKPLIEIIDEKGLVIRTFKGPAEKGVNRASWDLCRKAFPSLYHWEWEEKEEEEDEEKGGLFVLPGTYTARVTYGDLVEKTTITVKPDPRLEQDETGQRRSHAMATEIGSWMKSLDKVLKIVANRRKAIGTLQSFIPTGKDKEEPPAPEALKKLREAAQALDGKLKELKNRIVPDEELQGFNDDSNLLAEQVYAVFGLVEDSLEAPTQAAEVKFEKTRAALKAFLAEFDRFYEKELLPFQKQVADSGFSLFTPYEPQGVKE
ncbi:MAG: hypothetical protein JXO51_08490 [Candidatus Aminicenantes bacterium]|nr:hypothetical protein [Candidatus Aminicenantes bacterium]